MVAPTKKVDAAPPGPVAFCVKRPTRSRGPGGMTSYASSTEMRCFTLATMP